MQKGISKNENREKLTVLIDSDIKKDMKKSAIDEGCSIGELIEKLYKKSKGQ